MKISIVRLTGTVESNFRVFYRSLKLCSGTFKAHKRKVLMRINLVIALMTGAILQASAISHAQEISLSKQNASLISVIREIQAQSSYDFVYSTRVLKKAKNISISVSNVSLEEALEKCFRNQPFTYTLKNKTIIIKENDRILPAIGLEKRADITGKVVDEKGEALIGATIKIKNSGRGVSTDINGDFKISALPGDVLQISYLGYETIERTVGSETVITVKMVASDNQLQEVTVSYGKQASREITGSITTINAAGLQDMPVVQFSQQLMGKAAGLKVVQSSGRPGIGVDFRIRGAASFFSGSQPLFVIDGLPVTGIVSNINPAEIESFSILKDASATALYGSRASNGVILITTKHAKAGDSKIQFNSNFGMQKIPGKRVPRTMNATEFAQFMKERWEDKVKYEGLNPATTPLDAEYRNPESLGKGTYWYDVMTRSAPVQNYDLTIQSAREKSSSTIIAGYQEQEGVVINTATKLFSLRFNQDLSLGNKLKIGFNVAPSYRLNNNVNFETDGQGGLFANIIEASPLIAPVNPDGSLPKYATSPGMVNYINPYANFTRRINDTKNTRILGNAYVNYSFAEGLALKTNFGVDRSGESQRIFNPSLVNPNSMTTGSSASIDNSAWTAETNLEYRKQLFTDHNIEALVGYSAQKFESLTNSVSGTGFPSDDVPYLSAATVISAGTSNASEYSLLSSIARLNYNYKSKYLLSGAIRNDGSSRFGATRKWGYFPSVSAGWVVSDEKFMETFKPIDFLKLRASYGISGNNDFGNYVAIAGIGAFNYVFNGALSPGLAINTLGNTDLAWERNKQFDIGVDLNILNNRISLVYDYYNKITDGLILNRPIPRGSGFENIRFNVGVVKFWGHEFGVNSKNLTGNLTWNTNFNIYFNRNLIKSLVSPGFFDAAVAVTANYYRNQEGYPLGQFYGFVFEGLYKDAADLASSAKYGALSDVGTIKMRDISGANGAPDGLVDNVYDRTFIGDPTPDFDFGLTNDFSYKNLDLSITMAGAVGGDMLAVSKWAYTTNLDGSRLPLQAIVNRWRSPENPGDGVYPRTKAGTTALGRSVNSQWIEDGSYLTAKNIALGYTFKLSDNLLLKNLRVYGSVQQAFTITGYTGLNPEVNADGQNGAGGIGVDATAYPVPRTFSIGLSSTFK